MFRVGPTRYGLDIETVDEILIPPAITRVPRGPGGMLGLAQVRDRVLPVFDLHWKFSVDRTTVGAASRMIVVEIDGEPVALLVDNVDEVAMVEPAAFQDVRPPGDPGDLSYLAGVVRWGDDLVLWVDPQRLVPRAVALAGKRARATA